MDYKKCVEELINIPKFGKKSGFDNITILLERLNNPHKKLKYIHVAGTNGKGSVCAMLASILIDTKLKVGLFTSPHLIKVNERIKINDIDIKDEEFTNLYLLVKKEIAKMIEEGYNHPTFFEIIFVISILYFYYEEVDIVILETGLGGRLDSTNIIKNTIVSIITKIGHDHNSILGNTIDKIAYEKGGIIKEKGNVILYNDNNIVKEIIEDICMKNEASLKLVLPLDYKILKRNDKRIDFSINNKYYNYKELTINTSAVYQLDNVAIALTAINVIRKYYNIECDNIKNGIYNFKWPGRMEIINNSLIVDAAHNVDGIKEFVKNINSSFANKKFNIIFTCMKDKDYINMIKELKKCNKINKIIITKLNFDKNISVDLLLNEFRKNGFNNIETYETIEEAYKNNNKLDSKTMLAFVGSLYLVGEIKKIIQEV
jgi:dihydrofolate synthase/folylpolyglutamate synthase